MRNLATYVAPENRIFGTDSNYFCLAAIHIENRAAYEMFTQQNPTFLIDERWIRLPIFRWRDKDCVVVDFDTLFPWDEFIRPTHTVFDIDPYRLGIRLHQPKNQIRDLSDFLAEFIGTNSPLEQMREIEELVILRQK